LLDKISKKSNSLLLKQSIKTNGLPLFMMYHQLWSHPRVGELVVPFLVLMHQVIRASVPLMKAASSVAAKATADPLNKLLHEYLEVHIEEEAHHDLWLMEDLESAGLARSEILALTPSTSVAAMAGSQYYWIHHHHPVALLGYIRLLEGNPPSVEHVERLQTKSGLSESVFRTYRMHGEIDPHHLQEFDEMLDELPLTQDQVELLGTSASYSADMLANAVSEIMSAAEQQT